MRRPRNAESSIPGTPVRPPRWRRAVVGVALLLALVAGLWGYAVPRRARLVAEFPGQAGVPKISVNAHGFLHVLPKQRLAQYRDWDGHLLAEYRMPPRKTSVTPLAAVSPDGRTVAMLDYHGYRRPALLCQWHDGRLIYQTSLTLPASWGFPVLVARDNEEVALLLHNETPLQCNYYDLVGMVVIRQGKVAAVQCPWSTPTLLAADGRTVLPGAGFRQVQVARGHLTLGPPAKAVLPPASRLAEHWFTNVSADATWAVISGGDLCNPAPTRRVTAWNLRTGHTWQVTLPHEAEELVAAISDDGQALALRGVTAPAGNLAPLLQRLPARTPLRAKLLAPRPALLVYGRSGRCRAVLPAAALATLADDWYDWQIYLAPTHRRLLVTEMRTIRLYKW